MLDHVSSSRSGLQAKRSRRCVTHSPTFTIDPKVESGSAPTMFKFFWSVCRRKLSGSIGAPAQFKCAVCKAVFGSRWLVSQKPPPKTPNPISDLFRRVKDTLTRVSITCRALRRLRCILKVQSWMLLSWSRRQHGRSHDQGMQPNERSKFMT